MDLFLFSVEQRTKGVPLGNGLVAKLSYQLTTGLFLFSLAEFHRCPACRRTGRGRRRTRDDARQCRGTVVVRTGPSSRHGKPNNVESVTPDPNNQPTSGPTTVRRAEVGDATLLAEVHRDAVVEGYRHIFPETAAPPTIDELVDQWQRQLDPATQDRRSVAVAVNEMGVIGVVVAGPDPIEAGVGLVSRLHVRPEAWGQRIGTDLYTHAVQHLGEAGFSDAALWVLEANDRARTWYERLGWEPTGERKTVFAPAQVEELRYKRRLH